MELIDVVRGSYGYHDEYIIDKTFSWLYNSAVLIRRRIHDDHVGQAIQIGKLLAGKRLKYWDDSLDEIDEDHVWIEDEEKIKDPSDLGIGIGKIIKKDG